MRYPRVGKHFADFVREHHRFAVGENKTPDCVLVCPPFFDAAFDEVDMGHMFVVPLFVDNPCRSGFKHPA